MWQLFNQPLALHRMFKAWGLENDPSLWRLRRRILGGDSLIRGLLTRFALILIIIGPVVSFITCGALSFVMEIDWTGVAFSLAFGLAFGLAVGLAVGLARGVAFGVAFGVAGGVAFGLAFGVKGVLAFGMARGGAGGMAFGVAGVLAGGLAGGLALGVVGDVGRSVARGVAGGLAGGLAVGLAGGLAVARALGVAGGVAVALAVALAGGAAGGVALLRLPFFLVATLLIKVMSSLVENPMRSLKFARWIPYRHHDLIRFPLPGLSRLLLQIARYHPTLARELIDEAFATIAQTKPARRALYELQARDLEAACNRGEWSRIAALEGVFFPRLDDLDPNDPLHKFSAAAQSLVATETGGSQRRRRNLLTEARTRLDSLRVQSLQALSGERAQRLHVVADAWLAAVDAKLEVLRVERERSRELDNVFVVGPALNPDNPDEVALFRTRKDIVSIIDRDLDDDRRGVVLLTGQRRMGKTSLLKMLPRHLGTATTLAYCSFQELSGEHGHAPHRLVIEGLTAALAKAGKLAVPPQDKVTDAWKSALDWLELVDTELVRVDHRALVLIDEVERIQDGANEGWASFTFLDFVRAAGDRLHRIRILLACAHQLASPRMDPRWADRLISALHRRLGPLPIDDAEQLLRKPVPDFPDTVFDDEATATILAQTGTHPFLIQAVGSEVVKRLSSDRRVHATAHDVARALDDAVGVAGLVFKDLWQDFSGDEQGMMLALARGEPINDDTATFRGLREQFFVERDEEGVPKLTFPLFGRWIRSYQA